MTRRRLLLVLLAAAAPALHAQSFVLAGAGAGYVSQPTAALHPWSAGSLGLSLHSYGQLAGGFASPLSTMAGLLSAPLRNLAYALAQVRDQREAA